VRRIAALVVAIGLIVVALVIRSNRDAEKRLGPYRLTCAAELADACRSLPTSEVTVTIEPGGVTADRLIALATGSDTGFDGWLTAGRWTRMVAETRTAAGVAPLTDKSSVLGHTRVGVVGWRDRFGVLRKGCGGGLSWRCVGDAAARGTWKANGGPDTWGLVKVALADPVTESAGLAGLAAATAGFDASLVFGGADPAQNDGYQRWLTGLAKAVPRPSPSIAAILTAGPAVADIYIGLETEIASVVGTSARRNDVEIVYLPPVVDIEAVMVSPTRATPAKLAAAVRKAGWSQDPDKAAMPLPPNGALAGLRGLWKDTVR
jgi:hypothetical protein